MKRQLTITLPEDVWETVIDCIPNSELLSVPAMQKVIAFMSEHRRVKEESRPRSKPIVYEEPDQDS